MPIIKISKLLKSIWFNQVKAKANAWSLLLFILTLIIGVALSAYVAKSQDDEMRDNLITYANTIERSIDWRPFAVTLNTNPDQIKLSDLSEINHQLNDACRANRDCHFIYLLYQDDKSTKPQVKFLLDASPQPLSEISQLAEVFAEATDVLKQAMKTRKSIVEGPVTDHWGTWVSVRVPIVSTLDTPHFVMLNIDVAANQWNQYILKKMIAPVLSTLVFLVILGVFVYQNRLRERLLAQLFHSTSELSEIANNDALTGLPNRRLLEDRMAQALKAAKRMQNSVGVLFLDLDYFKIVNDTYGHDIGDRLLKLVAVRINNLLRTEDTVARIGGDEFVVLLPNIADETQAINTAEKIINVLTMPFNVANQPLQLGVSIGISLYPNHDVHGQNLIKCADMAMYSAKRQGRNCYAMHTDDLESTD